ncbi:MAG TPA: type 4a pilus biogenesis protein PilO [Thermodesulfobacteriota bacterium]|nr:type 4a pilus biogenesis protein PilO [Thermodesulfobacteriota bacterium]
MAALKIDLDSVLKLPLKKRVLILVAINVVLAGLIYWLFTGPKMGEIKRLNVNLQDLNAKLAENRTIAADIPRYLKEKEDMENKLKAAVAQLPNEKEIPDLIDGISLSGQKAGLKILLFKPEREIKKGFYAEVPVNMKIEGRYESFYNFSLKVANLPRIVNISGMDIQSEGHKNKVPVLKASFVATTFRFIPSQPEGAPKK